MKKAVMYGNGESHLVMPIQLAMPIEGEAGTKRVEELWPLMDSCDQKMSRGKQVARHAVIFATNDKLLALDRGGDVQMKLAPATYETESAYAAKVW